MAHQMVWYLQFELLGQWVSVSLWQADAVREMGTMPITGHK